MEEKTTTISTAPPKFVFIVPYRDREQHRVFFSTYIHHIMEDVPATDWTYFFVHQNDKRPFNRGGMKNIGFLALKYRYPSQYKDIIFIFNDIDTLPYTKNILDYNTDFGTIKHFYGFNFALGGIFSIRGADFERINGFPNFWAWGGEDNLIYERAKQNGIIIDRRNFYTIGNMNILQFADGFKRLICRDELATSIMPNNIDGLNTIKNLNQVMYPDTHMIDVNTFEAYISHSQLRFEEQSLDKVSKIRVSPLEAVRNIKELKSNFFIDAKNTVHIVQHNNLPESSHLYTPGLNTLNQTIKPKLPFAVDLNNRTNQRDYVSFIPQDKKLNVNTAPPPQAIGRETVINGRVYHNNRPEQNVVIPLQGQKRFGMRAMFM